MSTVVEDLAPGTQSVADAGKAVSKAAWKKAAFHLVTLPSSAVVKIKLPDMPALIEAGAIPQNLLNAAFASAKQQANNIDKEITKEDIVQQREFTDFVVMATVVEPQLTEADMGEIPFEDKEMIVEFATRVRDLDAEMRHIGGLDGKSERFRQVRGLASFDEAVEGL